MPGYSDLGLEIFWPIANTPMFIFGILNYFLAAGILAAAAIDSCDSTLYDDLVAHIGTHGKISLAGTK